ncbi:hypothetical protein GCM10009037_13530 [Halarchaeum grantii]|uniref:DUF8151 domain-containing protein n=1 Tax=Halarchaeum grantii TaxID=1193105 RepID=A0A830F8U9_9EURY|nr:hypothetical protein [Halarchaeum grantii]GGL31088.1 hypothetical protein GCM10009037_13530 [Halarchaeum grantii]
MVTPLLESLPELLEVAVFGIGSLLLSVGGLALERFALVAAESGRLPIGVWATVLGLVAITVAYLVARDRVRPRVAALR